mmetsp:Transcript_84580/g.192788  ORF Transcript_84580/g.192788 Transcript_84580/m.192788 type:complete len:211 (+) Transcript_84580:1005-1637(+)
MGKSVVPPAHQESLVQVGVHLVQSRHVPLIQVVQHQQGVLAGLKLFFGSPLVKCQPRSLLIHIQNGNCGREMPPRPQVQGMLFVDRSNRLPELRVLGGECSADRLLDKNKTPGRFTVPGEQASALPIHGLDLDRCVDSGLGPRRLLPGKKGVVLDQCSLHGLMVRSLVIPGNCDLIAIGTHILHHSRVPAAIPSPYSVDPVPRSKRGLLC